jgi:FkbM family methyltransferase
MHIEEKRKLLLKKLERFEFFLIKNNFKKGKFIRNIYFLIKFPFKFLEFILCKFLPFKKRVKILSLKDINLKMGNNSAVMLLWGFIADLNELKLTKFLIKNLNSDDIFYDIGANYGFYTYLALEFCKEVHSFEPIPECCESLISNLKNEGNVFINKIAVSDSNGVDKLTVPIRTFGIQSFGMSSINPVISENLKKLGSLKKIKVNTIKLDDYIVSNTPPTILKIDVEGAEYLVLKGGYNLLTQFNPTVIMEVWGFDNNGEISMEAVDLLRSLGYKSYFIEQDGSLRFVDGNLSEMIKGFDNFVFKK